MSNCKNAHVNLLISIACLLAVVSGSITAINLNRCAELLNGTCLPPSKCKHAMPVNASESDSCGDSSNNTICCLVPIRKVGDISKEKCEEIYQWRRKYVEPASLIIGGGGYDANTGEYPHMAALAYDNENETIWGCAGSLISERFVLTAAHCVKTNLGDVKRVRLGALHLDSDKEKARRQDFDIARVVVHPRYKAPAFYDDIALIELDGAVDVHDFKVGAFIAPACLQTEHEITDPGWRSTGWGETYYNGPPAHTLQVIELEETDREVCKRSFQGVGPRLLGRGIDEDTQLCAKHANRDACQGDSGGPLQVRNADFQTGYTVIGVTSFGPPCLLTSLGGVYTRVSPYIEWIESIVWLNRY